MVKPRTRARAQRLVHDNGALETAFQIEGKFIAVSVFSGHMEIHYRF
jgi:hypothetical protein